MDMREIIGEKRYAHTKRVEEMAVRLAALYAVDVEKARIAAHYHDCMKIKDRGLLFAKAEELGLSLTEELKRSPELIHAPLGSLAAKKIYGIKDEDILTAIAEHTTGSANMSTLSKVLYLADMVEEGREFLGVEKIREAAFRDLDEAMRLALSHTLHYLLNQSAPISLESIRCYNALV